MQLTAFTYKLCERMDSSSTVLFIKKKSKSVINYLKMTHIKLMLKEMNFFLFKRNGQ